MDNGVARRWLHGGAWVAALMAGRRAGSRAKGRTVPFIGKGGGGGRAGTQRPGKGLAREGDGEVAGLRDVGGGVSRRGVCGGAWQLDAEPGRSGLGELVLGEVRS